MFLRLLLIPVSLLYYGMLQGEELSFTKDVRPLLSDACFHCHGPDEAESGLRLDEEDGVQAAFGEVKLADNLAWRRIHSKDPDEKMPPPAPGNELKQEELQLLEIIDYQFHLSDE